MVFVTYSVYCMKPWSVLHRQHPSAHSKDLLTDMHFFGSSTSHALSANIYDCGDLHVAVFYLYIMYNLILWVIKLGFKSHELLIKFNREYNRA